MTANGASHKNEQRKDDERNNSATRRPSSRKRTGENDSRNNQAACRRKSRGPGERLPHLVNGRRRRETAIVESALQPDAEQSASGEDNTAQRYKPPSAYLCVDFHGVRNAA